MVVCPWLLLHSADRCELLRHWFGGNLALSRVAAESARRQFAVIAFAAGLPPKSSIISWLEP